MSKSESSPSTPMWRQSLSDFTDFLNEPQQYEEQHRVRDYRHEAYRKWEAVMAAILPRLEGVALPADDVRAEFKRLADAWYAGWQSKGRDGFMEALRLAYELAPVSESVTLTERETVTIKNLLGLARALDFAMDDSEELRDGSVQVPNDHANLLVLGLACLNELPDDQPGCVMTGPAKARWSLRRLGDWSIT